MRVLGEGNMQGGVGEGAPSGLPGRINRTQSRSACIHVGGRSELSCMSWCLYLDNKVIFAPSVVFGDHVPSIFDMFCTQKPLNKQINIVSNAETILIKESNIDVSQQKRIC